MALAQLVEWSLPTPEIRGSNPVIGKITNYRLYIKKLKRKDENEDKKRPGLAQFKNKHFAIFVENNIFLKILF